MAQNTVTLYGNGVQRRFILPTNLAVVLDIQSDAPLGAWSVQDDNELVFSEAVPFGAKLSVEYADGNTYSGGSGGGSGITPEDYANLAQDAEVNAATQQVEQKLSDTQGILLAGISNGTNAVLDAVAAAAIPPGFIAEFPANQVPASGWEVVQGQPSELPVGFATVSAGRTTGNATTHRGFARTLATSRIWSLYGSTMAALDLALNKYDALTHTLPVSLSSSFKGAVLHDLTDSKALVTLGTNSAGTFGDARAYTFDANTKAFTQVANFQLTGVDGQVRAGCGGSTLRLANGRLFWLPSETWRTGGTVTAHSNLNVTNGGFYFLYDPVTNVVTSQRFSNWATVLGATDLQEAGSGSAQQGLHGCLPLGQLPDGRLLLQEMAPSGSSRYFFLDLTANTIALGTGVWTSGSWAFAAHPQGLVCFSQGSSARRYYNSVTNVMDAANASTFSSASVSGVNTGFFYKALPIGSGNYALPAATNSADAMALAYDSFVRLGTVKARKV